MAMVLDEAIDASTDLRILATDINRQVLQHAREGRYSAVEISQIPTAYRHRFGGENRADERLRSLISFQHLNLAHPPFPMQGPMDAIFCRNVLIYFDAALRKRLVDEFRRLLRPDGLLIVGHAEGMANDVAGFATLRPSVYRWLGRSAT